MSAYQRFISYMYEYHGNTRHQNCGYARIDNRNQLLKLEIHMKVSATNPENPLHIYGCFQRDGQLYGIEFGQHIPTLGMVNWRMQCASEDLAQTGVSFGDLEGLVLSDESPVSYCSIWNDQSVQPVNLIPYPLTVPEEETDSDPADNAVILTENLSQEKSVSFSDISQDVASTADNIPSMAEKIPSVDNASVASAVSDAPAGSAEDSLSSAPVEEEISAPAQASHVVVEEQPRTAPTLVERILAQEFTDTSAGASVPQTDTVQPKAAKSRPFTRWERLTHRFPAANVFTEGELRNCLRIEPRDIPVLRREGFHIAGNRFILHCLQRDSHCLLGRIGDSEQYVFAIPGIYDSQERFMANMFGFPCFCPLDDVRLPTEGQKGYWYRSVH